jgi:hypothetical protein
MVRRSHEEELKIFEEFLTSWNRYVVLSIMKHEKTKWKEDLQEELEMVHQTAKNFSYGNEFLNFHFKYWRDAVHIALGDYV